MKYWLSHKPNQIASARTRTENEIVESTISGALRRLGLGGLRTEVLARATERDSPPWANITGSSRRRASSAIFAGQRTALSSNSTKISTRLNCETLGGVAAAIKRRAPVRLRFRSPFFCRVLRKSASTEYVRSIGCYLRNSTPGSGKSSDGCKASHSLSVGAEFRESNFLNWRFHSSLARTRTATVPPVATSIGMPLNGAVTARCTFWRICLLINSKDWRLRFRRSQIKTKQITFLPDPGGSYPARFHSKRGVIQ